MRRMRGKNLLTMMRSRLVFTMGRSMLLGKTNSRKSLLSEWLELWSLASWPGRELMKYLLGLRNPVMEVHS